jgi:hypothetical protein
MSTTRDAHNCHKIGAIGGMSIQHATNDSWNKMRHAASTHQPKGCAEACAAIKCNLLPGVLGRHMATAECNRSSRCSSPETRPHNSLSSNMRQLLQLFLLLETALTAAGSSAAAAAVGWMAGVLLPAPEWRATVAGGSGGQGRQGQYRRASTGSAAANGLHELFLLVMTQTEPDLRFPQPSEKAPLAWQLRGGSGGVTCRPPAPAARARALVCCCGASGTHKP